MPPIVDLKRRKMSESQIRLAVQDRPRAIYDKAFDRGLIDDEWASLYENIDDMWNSMPDDYIFVYHNENDTLTSGK